MTSFIHACISSLKTRLHYAHTLMARDSPLRRHLRIWLKIHFFRDFVQKTLAIASTEPARSLLDSVSCVALWQLFSNQLSGAGQAASLPIDVSYAPLVLWGTCSPYSHPYHYTRLASSSRSEFKVSGHKSAWRWHWEGRMATYQRVLVERCCHCSPDLAVCSEAGSRGGGYPAYSLKND